MVFHAEIREGFWLVIAVLATWRLTSFFHYEEGPFGLCALWRKVLGHLRLRCLVECFHCLGFWVAAGMVGVLYEPELLGVLMAFAVAGGASIIELAVGKGDSPPTEEASDPQESMERSRKESVDGETS